MKEDRIRQMPSTKDYISAPVVKTGEIKGYSDLIYGYLQTISRWSGKAGDPRVVCKQDAKITVIANNLKISRQTVSKRLADLESRDLIYKDKNGNIVLNILAKEDSALIDNNLLGQMVLALKDNTINLYLYLFARYKANNKKEFIFTYGELKRAIGLSDKTRSNDYIIKSLLNILANLGLLNLRIWVEEHKSTYFITYMTDVLPDKVEEAKIVKSFC